MTTVNPDRRSRAPGRRCFVGVVCLVMSLCCTGCGKAQESRRRAPTPVEAAPSRASGAARPAAKPRRPAAPVEPAPELAAEQPAPPAAWPETLEEIIDAVAEETASAVEGQPPAAEKPAFVVAAEPRDQRPAEVPAPPPPADPDNPPDHVFLAEAARERGDCQTAAGHFRQARLISPDDLGLRLREAETYRRCGWPGEALELLRELDSRSRALEAVAAEIAECLHLLGEPARAAMAWELRYIHYPGAWRAAAHAAEAWLAAGQHEPAQWWYERARRDAPNTPEVQALATVFQSAAVTDR